MMYQTPVYWNIGLLLAECFCGEETFNCIMLLLFARWAGSWRTWWTCCVGTLQVSPWRWRNAHRAHSPRLLLCSRTWDGNRWRCKYDCCFHPPQICWCMPCFCIWIWLCYVCICVYLCASVHFHVKNKTGQTSDTRHQRLVWASKWPRYKINRKVQRDDRVGTIKVVALEYNAF